MKRIKGNFRSPVVAVLGLAMFFFVASRLPSLQAQTTHQYTQATKQDVADTPAPRPAPVQPIPFSHKLHLALSAKLECQGCHGTPDAAGLMAFSNISTCMSCHASTAKNKPSIQKLAEFNKSKKPIPWVQVYKVLPGTQWNHRTHLDGGMKCVMCHGDVSQMDEMTNVKSVTSMGGCLGCHELHKANDTCVTCHHAWDIDMVIVKASKKD